MRFQFIQGNQSFFPVKKMCPCLQVSLSGFYRWCNVSVSKRKTENLKLKSRFKKLSQAHMGRADSPMITTDFRDEPEFSNVSHPRVTHLMTDMGLKCKSIGKFVVTTDSRHNSFVSGGIGEPTAMS